MSREPRRWPVPSEPQKVRGCWEEFSVLALAAAVVLAIPAVTVYSLVFR